MGGVVELGERVRVVVLEVRKEMGMGVGREVGVRAGLVVVVVVEGEVVVACVMKALVDVIVNADVDTEKVVIVALVNVVSDLVDVLFSAACCGKIDWKFGGKFSVMFSPTIPVSSDVSIFSVRYEIPPVVSS